jgi:hypothetical protein
MVSRVSRLRPAGASAQDFLSSSRTSLSAVGLSRGQNFFSFRARKVPVSVHCFCAANRMLPSSWGEGYF